MAGLPAWAFAAAVARACGGDHRRISRALAGRDPAAAWALVQAGGVGEAAAAMAAAVDPALEQAACEQGGVAVLVRGGPSYPPALLDDHEAPEVLFARGDPAPLGGPRVGLVGTRRCTHYGRDVARQLGRELAEAGVCVVSGLAAGIDGAAHTGAVEAAATGGRPPVAVVGSGLDVVYPVAHAQLWDRVATTGAVLTEAPLGAHPEAWRFPARNRILAALSQVLVVIESHRAGGSMHTVRAADERGVAVMAVPGAIRSPASTGTNQLLADGCAPACSTDDILAALSLTGAGPAPVARSGGVASPPALDGLAAEHEQVLAAVDWAPTATEAILSRTGLGPLALGMVLARLEEAGLVRAGAGWWERRS